MQTPQTVFKQARQSSSQAAQSVVRGIADQAGETLKNAQGQIGLPVSEKVSSPENAVYESPDEFTPVTRMDTLDREAIAQEERAALAQLEAKLAQIRARRTQEVTAYKDSQQSMMDASRTPSVAEAPQAQGKISKAIGRAKKAVTSLISNRKQGETKQGAGKG